MFISVVAFGQKMQQEEVTFSDIRLPLAPLGNDLQHYQFTVKTPYPENNNAVIEQAKAKYEQDVANYPQTVEESKAKYERDLVEYDAQVVVARENFRIESEQYNNLTMVERMAMADQKPTLKLPSKPAYYKPSEPTYQEPNLSRSITYSPELLASSVKLYGYTKGTENALVGTITLYDFENLEPQRKVEEKNVYNTQTKKTEMQRTYSYTVAYKRPTYLKLEFNGQILYDGVFEGTSEYSEFTSAQSPNLFNLEKQSVDGVLAAVNEYINNNYGQTLITRTIKIGYVKNKDGLYDDLEKAKNLAVSGLKSYEYGKPNKDIDEAISIWEKVLEETDLSDKKARIDAKAYEEILFNLNKVSLATYQLEKAEMYINTLKTVKLSGSEKKELDIFEFELNDRKQRVAASKM